MSLFRILCSVCVSVQCALRRCERVHVHVAVSQCGYVGARNTISERTETTPNHPPSPPHATPNRTSSHTTLCYGLRISVLLAQKVYKTQLPLKHIKKRRRSLISVYTQCGARTIYTLHTTHYRRRRGRKLWPWCAGCVLHMHIDGGGGGGSGDDAVLASTKL